MIKTAILTISDSCSEGRQQDLSGQTIADILKENDFDVCDKRIVADEAGDIITELIYYSDEAEVDIVFTTGGTGMGPRDITPEATISVCEKIVPGIGELMRFKGLEKTPNAILSRSIAGIRKDTLIINLPGSPRAVRECLDVVMPVLPHALKMMRGGGH
ncbi:MAG: MogA/MoaB family molybdenum cofactor biosynthesis protein [Planctomycetota bacterium]|jgi:molybdenum cofactor synthesis domain-containing protein